MFGDLASAPRFSLFGLDHGVTLAAAFVVCIAVPIVGRALSDKGRIRLAWWIGGAILVVELLIKLPVRVAVFDFPLSEELPLHLCRLGALAGAWLMFTRSSWAFDLVYFWAFGGGVLAVLTPDIRIGPPHMIFLLFYVGHTLEILAVTYAMVVFGLRPTFRSVVRCLVVTQLLMVVIYPLNLLLGSNYLFLNRPPVEASIIDSLGSGWQYLVGLELLAAFFILLCYVPFFLWDLRAYWTRWGPAQRAH